MSALGGSRTCSACKREKPLTPEHFYVERETDRGPSFRHQCIPCYGELRRERLAADPETRARIRERDRKAAARERSTEEGRRAQNERCRRWREKVMADPARRLAQAEAARIRRRLKAEREGRTMATSPVQAPEASGERVPVRPVAEAIGRLIERERRRDVPFGDSEMRDELRARVCERLKIGERTLYAWRIGQRVDAELGDVDEVLVRADWLWFDVFNEETVRAGLDVGVFTMTPKTLRGGSVKLYRSRMRTVRYGDWGPDLRTLALVEALFTGEGLPVAEEQLQLAPVTELRPVEDAARAAA